MGRQAESDRQLAELTQWMAACVKLPSVAEVRAAKAGFTAPAARQAAERALGAGVGRQ